ncbi:hypothetical protein EP7_003088 [Isosphaeraceae bacterium EP7]
MNEARVTAGCDDLEARWATILRKLEANAGVLARQGTLVAKDSRGRRVWAVRFVAEADGRRVHRAIYVAGDDRPELVDRTAQLLCEYRLQGRWAGQVEVYARLAAGSVGLARRLASNRRPSG